MTVVRKSFKQQLDHLTLNVKKYGSDFRIPSLNDKFADVETNSWFDAKINQKYNFNNHEFNIEYQNLSNTDDGYSTRFIELFPTFEQIKVLDNWSECYVKMYNETISVLRKMIHDKKSIKKITYNQLRDNYMKSIKQKIHEESAIKVFINNKHTISKMPMHELNMPIYSVFKTKIEMVKSLGKDPDKGRLRYIKMSKENKHISICKESYTKTGFCVSNLGKIMKCGIDDFDYKSERITTNIVKKIKGKYFLLLKFNRKEEKTTTDDTIGIDLGEYPTVNGYAKNTMLQINTNKEIIRNKLREICRLQSLYDSGYIKNNPTKKRWKKLRNMVMDFRWKVANYLTSNYSHIVVGKISTKDICEKDELSDISKTAISVLSLYKLRQTIKYYALRRGVKYCEIPEPYTSKLCGNCTKLKNDLGGEKEYKCSYCKVETIRDLDSGRKITIKSINYY